MLPEALVSTYHQYKQDTNFVASWLATTAKSCGYPSDLLSEVRERNLSTAAAAPALSAASAPDESEEPASATTDSCEQPGKNKKKKKKKAAPPTDEFPSSAPKKYTVAIKEFIPLARFVSASKRKIARVPDSFVSALNRVIALRSGFGAQLSQHGLKPSKVADQRHSYFLGVLDQVRQVLRPRMTAEGARASNETPDSLSNRFSNLNLFEPSQEFLNAPDAKPAMLDRNTVYEAETAVSGEDAVFFFQLLWRDLFEIRLRIRRIWNRHMQDQIKFDQASAAVATNTALDLARHLIDDVIPDLEAFEGGIYGAMKEQTVMMLHRIRGDPGNLLFGLSTSTPDDVEMKFQAGVWTYADAYNILTEILPPLMQDGPPIGPILPRTEATEAGPDNHWRTEHYNELKSVFGDLMVVAESIKDWPVEDTLLRGLRETIETRKIPFYLVFASAILLDLNRCFKIGDEHIKKDFLIQVEVTQDMVMIYHTLNDKSGSSQVMKPYDAQVRQVAKECTWIKEDRIYESRLRRLPKESRAEAKATLEKHSLFRRNAIMCGLVLFRHRLMLYRAGLSLANTTGSIVAAGHLCNAAMRQRLLDKGEWPDMQVALGFLASGKFWPTGVPPSYRQDYAGDILRILGFTDIANSRLIRAKPLPGRAKCNFREDFNPTSAFFFERYVTHRGQTGTGNWNAEDVLHIVEAARQARVDNELHWHGKAQEFRTPGTALRTQHLVEAIFGNLLEERWRITYPFVILHAEAFGIMKTVASRCEPLLNRILGPAKHAVSELDWSLYAAWILQAFSAFDQGKEALKSAADVLNERFEDEGPLYWDPATAMIKDLGWTPRHGFGGSVYKKGQEDNGEEAGGRQLQGPVDPRQMPLDIARMQESFGMPIDYSQLGTGVYIDTSRMRGNVKQTRKKIMIGEGGDDPFEVTQTTISW